jgi:hypothetical protein
VGPRVLRIVSADGAWGFGILVGGNVHCAVKIINPLTPSNLQRTPAVRHGAERMLQQVTAYLYVGSPSQRTSALCTLTALCQPTTRTPFSPKPVGNGALSDTAGTL